MEGKNQHLAVRGCISQWILICFILPYSEAACLVENCNLSQCNANTCYGCKDGYYLRYGSLCIPCQPSLPYCVTCSSSTYCTRCTDGYYLQSGSCIQCPDRCSTCTSFTQCTTCKDTYWNLQNDCYSTCSKNCTNNVCDDTTGYCYDCKPGTYGPLCGQDCNLCKDGQCDLRKCTNGCKDGYFPENTARGYSYCFKCAYDNCLTCSNATHCSQCEQGYYRNYYRLEYSDRGAMNCMQCYESCLDCTSSEHCHEDCTHHCSVPVNPGTTKSTHESTTMQSTTSSFSTSMTDSQTQTKKTSEMFKSTETTATEDCQRLNGKLYEDLSSCQQQITTLSECEDQYQLAFGHGLATGIGISIVLFGSGVGIALLIRRRTKLHKHENEASKGNHEYVNTNMTNMWSVIASESTEETNDIPKVSRDSANTGVTDIDSSRDYVSLGDRPTHESNYSDLQNT